jgi:hypothetical protein
LDVVAVDGVSVDIVAGVVVVVVIYTSEEEYRGTCKPAKPLF